MSGALGSALVVGAGIVGTASALALQREGFAVTLVDRGAPGEACSLGNAGHIGTASVLPQAAPGIARAIPKLLRDPAGPLAVRWGYVARNLPWFARFLHAGTRERAERTAEQMAVLLARVGEAFAPLLRDAGAEDIVAPTGLLHVFRTEAALNGGRWAYDLRRRLGIAVRDLSAEETQAMEPALDGPLAGGVLLPDVATVRDPLLLTRRLVALFERRGGTVLRADVRDLLVEGCRARGIRTASGDLIEADLVVLSAGAWSPALAAKTGARVPVAAERGYHVMVGGSNAGVRMPLLLAEKRVAVTPMLGGLRLTSMAEFADPDAPPDHDRAWRTIEGAATMLPGVTSQVTSRWVGARPSTPDGRPVIGRAPRLGNVVLAYGHGHLGMTLAAVTGELVADIAQERAPSLDLSPFAPDRGADRMAA